MFAPVSNLCPKRSKGSSLENTGTHLLKTVLSHHRKILCEQYLTLKHAELWNTVSLMEHFQYIKSLYGRLILVQVNLGKIFQSYPSSCYFKWLRRSETQNHAKMFTWAFCWESSTFHLILYLALFFGLAISNDFSEVSSCSYPQLLWKCQRILGI